MGGGTREAGVGENTVRSHDTSCDTIPEVAAGFRAPVGLVLRRHVLGWRGKSAAPGQVCRSGAGATGSETKPGRSGEALVPLRGLGPGLRAACVECEAHDSAKESSPSCLGPC